MQLACRDVLYTTRLAFIEGRFSLMGYDGCGRRLSLTNAELGGLGYSIRHPGILNADVAQNELRHLTTYIP